MESALKDKGKIPLVVHIIYRLATGGLENGLVNLINNMPPERYRHAIICLTDSTNFRDRIRQIDVPVIALNKSDGQNLGLHARLWRVLRSLRPNIVHTRNLSALEYLIPAGLAGIPSRVHGEHGRDMYDLDGTKIKYNLLRKVVKPFANHFIAVSADLADWLVETVGIRPERVAQIYNGVDTERFSPKIGERSPIGPEGFVSHASIVIGTVGRMEPVKDQLTLVKAFIYLLDIEPDARKRLRLVIIGDGILRKEASKLLQEANATHLAWLPGERNDIPDIMRSLDLFILPSLGEGISNTILEAMASGLPVVATRVGGNPELLEEGRTGTLVPPGDPVAMAEAIRTYLIDTNQLIFHGQSGRKRAETRFSMEKMVNGYMEVYDAVLKRKGLSRKHYN